MSGDSYLSSFYSNDFVIDTSPLLKLWKEIQVASIIFNHIVLILPLLHAFVLCLAFDFFGSFNSLKLREGYIYIYIYPRVAKSFLLLLALLSAAIVAIMFTSTLLCFPPFSIILHGLIYIMWNGL